MTAFFNLPHNHVQTEMFQSNIQFVQRACAKAEAVGVINSLIDSNQTQLNLSAINLGFCEFLIYTCHIHIYVHKLISVQPAGILAVRRLADWTATTVGQLDTWYNHGQMMASQSHLHLHLLPLSLLINLCQYAIFTPTSRVLQWQPKRIIAWVWGLFMAPECHQPPATGHHLATPGRHPPQGQIKSCWNGTERGQPYGKWLWAKVINWAVSWQICFNHLHEKSQEIRKCRNFLAFS